MSNTISTALSGIKSATSQINQSANNIANIGNGDGGASLPRDIIDIRVAEVAFKANIAVLKAENELTEELLKTFDEEV